MPARNVVRYDVPETYYHVYARGASRQPIFLEHADYTYFIYLLKRYLAKEQSVSKAGVAYPNYHEGLELLVFCLMGNHFHLMVYQIEAGSLARFMKSLMVSYSRYFNLKYKRSGALFESRYKASPISSNAYLLHVSRYIHLNPRSWKRYPYSSIESYRSGDAPDWLRMDRVMALHESNKVYLEFLSDYEEHKQMLNEIKHELADK
jgi:putative transposase